MPIQPILPVLILTPQQKESLLPLLAGAYDDSMVLDGTGLSDLEIREALRELTLK